MVTFSFVVPTRNRPDTLRACLATLQTQDVADVEFIVQDNSTDDRTRDLVASLSDARIRYERNERSLAMTANWERGIANARGAWITVLGDDDGMMPFAARVCGWVAGLADVQVVTWTPHQYFWPSAVDPRRRQDRLALLSFAAHPTPAVVSAFDVLTAAYAFRVRSDGWPMIYQAFVHRSVIEAVTAKSGTYLAAGSPDLYSGIANCYGAERIARIDVALSVRGTSGHSNGSAQLAPGAGNAAVLRDFRATNAADGFDDHHPTLGRPLSLALLEAGVLAHAKDRLFADADDIRIDVAAVLREAGAHINNTPDLYDDVRAEIAALALRYGLAPDSVPIAPRIRLPSMEHVQGPVFGADGRLSALVVNCRDAGVVDVAGAVRLATALLPLQSVGR